MAMPAVQRRWTAREVRELIDTNPLATPRYELVDKRPVRELLIAAELLSPSSGRSDRASKREPYLRHVSEHWIVDLDSRLIERCLPNDERPQIVARELVWQAAGASEAFRLDLPWYFAEILGE